MVVAAIAVLAWLGRPPQKLAGVHHVPLPEVGITTEEYAVYRAILDREWTVADHPIGWDCETSTSHGQKFEHPAETWLLDADRMPCPLVAVRSREGPSRVSVSRVAFRQDHQIARVVLVQRRPYSVKNILLERKPEGKWSKLEEKEW